MKLRMEVAEIFRTNLTRYRLEAGLTAAELSRRAGLNVRAVKDIEEGRAQSPKLSTAIALADALGVDPGVMIGIGPRPKLASELLQFLEQYSEADQQRILAALTALPGLTPE